MLHPGRSNGTSVAKTAALVTLFAVAIELSACSRTPSADLRLPKKVLVFVENVATGGVLTESGDEIVVTKNALAPAQQWILESDGGQVLDKSNPEGAKIWLRSRVTNRFIRIPDKPNPGTKPTLVRLEEFADQDAIRLRRTEGTWVSMDPEVPQEHKEQLLIEDDGNSLHVWDPRPFGRFVDPKQQWRIATVEVIEGAGP